jgi:Histidine phosphatase superfamily (branch 1)
MTVIKSYDPSAEALQDDSSIASIEGPLIVIIRHGKTEHNKLGLFTGWEDAPLAAEGETVELSGLHSDVVWK